MLTPNYDEIHISVVFTWDKERAEELGRAWEGKGKVKIGGPAYGDPGGEFTPGMYLREGITITSRGCPNKCGFCLAQKREGGIRELEVKEGRIIQDNNILACSDRHISKVVRMLRGQRKIQFKGGLEAARVTEKIAELFRCLRIDELWLACDSKGAIKGFERAAGILRKAGFSREKILSYVLIGKDRDEEEERLRRVWRAGALPFAQLYQPEETIEYDQEWKDFARFWSRPAIYRSAMRKEFGNG